MVDRFLILILLIFIGIGCSAKLQKMGAVSPPTLIKNVVIDSSVFGMGPCEPSIDIEPSNTNHIVAGAVLNQFYESHDGGKTWAVSKLKSSYGVYGDPVLRMDNQGNAYYAHLSDPKGRNYQDEAFLDRIVVQKYNNGEWTDGSFPPCDHKKDQDKEWMDIHPATGDVVMTWTEFDKYGSRSDQDRSRILFSKSSDQGNTWTDAQAISEKEGDCIDNDFTTEGAVPAIDNEGRVYVAWSFDNKIWLDRSEDGGNTWLDKDLLISDQPSGWAYDIPGLKRCNGMPILEVDRSSGPHSGDLYVNWSDQRNGSNDTDIWIIKSSDKGNSWTVPKRVNDDAPGKHQFLSWMDIDPSTGYIYIIFYDRRNHEDNKTDVFLAYSIDGGDNFRNIKVSESPFTPNTKVFFGDYNDISAKDNIIRPIWTRQEGLKLSVLTALIDMKPK